MKKFLGILVLIVLIVIIIFWLRSCSGFGLDDGNGDNGSARTEDVTDSPKPEDDTPPPEVEKEIVIKVSVVESEYFYDNERVDLDTLVEKSQEFDEKPKVQIIDDNASRKAYKQLTERLKELEITCLEEN